MNLVLWIVQGVLAAVFLASGARKLATPRTQLVAAGGGNGWAEDVTDDRVKAIGTAEVLGAIGLILPAALGVAVVLTPIAAVGLAVVMLGAVATHARRGETNALAVPLVLAVLALFVAVMRF